MPTTTADTPRPTRGAWRFARHYLEMVVAMMVGMALIPVSRALVDLPDGTGFELAEMAVWMTVPMVAWMRFRGHGRRVTAEMAAAMLVPAAALLALHLTGAVADGEALVMVEHTVMFPAMLVAMLLRRDEYTADHARHRAAAQGTQDAQAAAEPAPA
jgi:hypothetical protein